MPDAHTSASPPRTPEERRRRWRRRGLIALGLLLLYTLFGFAGVPLLIRHVVAPQVSKSLNGTLSIAKAHFNPFSFVVRLAGVDVTNDAGQRILGCAEFSCDFELLDTIFSSGYHFKDTIIREPFAHAELFPDGSDSLSRLIKPAPPPKPGSPPPKPAEPMKRIPRIVMRLLDVSGGTLEFRDGTLATPYATQVSGLDFALKGLDTRPLPTNPHTLVAKTSSGAMLAWEGTFRVDPLTSTGTLKLSGLELAQFMPYIQPLTRGTITSGTLATEITYDLAPAATPRVVRANVASLSIDGLGVAEPQGPLAKVTRVAVTDAQIDADARAITVASVSISAPALTLDRDAQGVPNIVRALPASAASSAQPTSQTPDTTPPANAATPPLASSEPKPAKGDHRLEQLRIAIADLVAHIAGDWSLAVEKVAIADGSAALTDHAVTPNVSTQLSGITLEAGPIRSSERFAVPLELHAAIAADGVLAVQGIVKPLDTSADLTVKAERLDASIAAPYLPAQFDASIPPSRLASARVALDGRAGASLTPDGTLDATWKGASAITGLSMEQAEGKEQILGIGSLAVNGDAGISIAGGVLAKATWKGTVETSDIAGHAPVAGPVALTLGHANVEGDLALAGAAMTFTGSAGLERLSVEAPQQQDVKFTLASARAQDISLDSAAQTGTVADVTLEAPILHAVMPLLPASAKDKPKPAEAPPASSPSTTATAASPLPPGTPTFKIQHLKIANGSGEITDPNAAPPLLLKADQFALDATGLSTDGQSLAQLTATSRVQDSGQMRLAGTINPFASSPALDMKIEIAALPLKPYDAITGRYVGYLVDQGRLTFTMPVAIQQGQLKGELDVNMDRFYLGESVKSPDAPDVPVKLGLDLLRDPSEQIKARVGFSGKLDDPNFSFGGIIWKAFFNLIIKAATAPFQVLGKLFGAAEGQDLSNIAFDPGLPDLSPSALSSLDVLGKGLRERPALKLTIVGRTSATDIPALKKILLRKSMFEIAKRDDRKVTALTDELYRANIDWAFGENYGRDLKRRQNAQGKFEPVPFEEMEAKMLEDTAVTPEILAALAKARAEAILNVLTKDNGVPADRCSIAKDPPKEPADQPKAELQMGK